MRLVLALISVALLSIATQAQEQTTDIINDKINNIDEKPSVRLDPYIRKALLKALSELEESENLTTGADTTEESSTVDSSFFRTQEQPSETLQPPKQKEEIQIHSFVVNGQAAFANSTNVTPTLIDNKISILSTTAGNVENHVTATLPTQSTFSEIFQTRESGVNVQQVRSIQSTPKGSSEANKISTSKPVPRPTTTTTTTSTTTTTTTPKPTHNDDGENIEDVDKRDVQVFQAPLVAAFTVHQDAQGLPKKVIPIFQQTSGQDPLKSLSATSLHSEIVPQQFNRHTLPHLNVNNLQQPDFIGQQLTLQKQLEEKQRILEEQLRLLQLQQRQQEELLRKQQFLLQQKEIQRQQQLLFNQDQLKRQQLLADQQKLQANNLDNNNFQLQGLQKTSQQNQFLNQNVIRPQNAQVTIQPSVSLEQNNLVANQQQLPNREAVDFLIHLRSQQPVQFPLQENHLPQGISNFLQPNPIQNFHQGPNSNQLRPLADPFGQKQGHRVFRQESGVGNFGFNNNNNNQNYNRFNTFNPITSNRFFPSNRANQFNPDSELKQLLVQTGLNGRSHEDLNIVTKVLSLNHGIPLNNNVSNRLPFDSRRHVRATTS